MLLSLDLTGTGKTTAFNCITGVYRPSNGQVEFNDKIIVSNHPSGKMKKQYLEKSNGKYSKVVSKTPDKITEDGIAHTFPKY